MFLNTNDRKILFGFDLWPIKKGKRDSFLSQRGTDIVLAQENRLPEKALAPFMSYLAFIQANNFLGNIWENFEKV